MHTRAVADAAVMSIKRAIALSKAPNSSALMSIQTLGTEALGRFFLRLKQWFLPHLVGAMGIFLLVAYVTSFVLFSQWSGWWKWIGIVVTLCVYGTVALGYSLFTTCVLAVRLASVEWNDFIASVLEAVQEQALSRIAAMNVGLTKPEATRVIRGSVQEVFAAIPARQTGLTRRFMRMSLGLMAMAVRAVLFAKISKAVGRTVQLGKLFAGRTTLVGAVFLNLHFFATLLLGICYLAGITMLGLNIYFVFLLK